MKKPPDTSPRHEAGEELSGFVIRRVEALPALAATVYHAEHAVTGTGVVHVHTRDDENLWGISFPTPRSDSTGVAHILEHCVLAGSHRYPVRDAFNELSKSTLATFLNAFTAPDLTCYPTCSRVPRDFENLASVYTDVVFHPRLAPETFRQEGHHRRLREDGTLEASGVVFNEMKGSYSSAERVAEAATLQRLMPDTCYGHESGGHPERILDLSYEEFLAFHRSCYTADNAYFFLYGDRPTDELLRFLGPHIDGAPRGTRPDARRQQPRWTSPRTTHEVFPADTAQGSRRTTVNIAWLTAPVESQEQRFVLEVLRRALVGGASSPLRRALVDSGLGEDLSPLSGIVTWYPEIPFVAGLRGTDPDRAEAVETLALDTLATTAAKGLDDDLLEAAFHEVELAHTELRRGSYPYPILLMLKSVLVWTRGHDPIEPLDASRHLAALRARWREEPSLFADAVRRHLVENPHRLRAVIEPSARAAADREGRIRARLDEERRAMTEAELARVREESAALERAQRTPDPKEVIDTLPRLDLTEIPPDVVTVPTTVHENGTRRLVHDVRTNGVTYVGLSFDVSSVPDALQPYVALLGEAVVKMGAAGRDFRSTATRVARTTGGVEAVVSAWDCGAGPLAQRLRISSSALSRNTEEMVAILSDAVTAGDLSDLDRLATVLVARRNRLRAMVAPRGHIFSWRSAAACLSLSRRRDEHWQGGAHVRFLADLTSQGGDDPLAIAETLKRIRDDVFTRERAIVSITGEGEELASARPAIDALVRALPSRPGGTLDEAPDLGPRRVAYVVPGNVCYVSRVVPVPGHGHPDAGALHVLASCLRNNVLYKKIRVEGGAYGGMAQYDAFAGHLVFMSYRDPHLERTLEVYDACLDDLLAGGFDEDTVRRTQIGTLGALERPIAPAQKGASALRWHLAGITDEDRRRLKAEILAVEADTLERVAEEIVRPALDHASEAVYAPRDRLERDAGRIAASFDVRGLD